MEQINSRFSKESRFDRASFLSKITLSYIFPVFFCGFRNNGLSWSDLGRCPKRDQVTANAERLERNWNQDLIGKNPRLWWTLTKTFGLDLVLPILAVSFQELVLRIAEPLCLSLIIRYFSNGDREDLELITYRDACYAALGVCLCSVTYIWFYHPVMLFSALVGMRMRSACCSLIYQKALRLNQASLGQTAVGQIVNLISNDVNRFDEFSRFFAYMLIGPLQTAVVIYIVWTYFGMACLTGSGFLVLLVPFQLLIGKLFSLVRSRTASLTDTRLRLMHEIVSGMRVIKMYCWQRPFARRVANARNAEISQIRRSSYLKALNMPIYFVATRIVVFISLVTYVLLDHTLTAESVFVSLALFNTVRTTMTMLVPKGINAIAELIVSCQRIESFLLLDESQSKHFQKLDYVKRDKNESSIPEETISKELNTSSGLIQCRSKPAQLTVDNICARWSPDLHRDTLKDISATLKPGDLLAVIGPVGSGKSSLLMSLLGELPVYSGDISLEGRLSYAGQDSWIFNDTVRNNILFGLEYDPKRFRNIVEVCALTKDLEGMPFGDQTLVGEKGVQLSGGQKARVNLARAVYRQADIYLMDDPLSAVDASVAEHIFERCIIGQLQNSIRVLVTHQIQFIQKATKILVLNEGQSLGYGSYQELQHLGIDFVNLNNSETSDLQNDKSTFDQKMSQETLVTTGDLNNDNCHKETKVKEELSERGSIKNHVYLEYIRAGASPLLFTVMVLFTLISQSLLQGSDVFLSVWTNQNQLKDAEMDTKTDILIYSVLIGSLFVTSIIRTISFFSICLRASEALHNQIFSRLIRTPISFFDTTPTGQILNRFSKDLGIVDEMLSTTACELNMRGIQVIGILVIICMVNWYMIFPSLIILVVMFGLRQFYIVSARDVKRFEGIARSPIYSHLNTTINGLASVRAFCAQQSFRKQFDLHLDNHSSTWFVYQSMGRAFSMMVNAVTVVYICIIIWTIMLIDDIPGGTVGLVISSVLMISQDAQWAARMSSDFESQMTSVERIVEYQNLEQEAPEESSLDLKPGSEWPAMGEIQFENLSLFYGNNSEDKPVLSNLNFRVRAGEKVGIVGRTGAGKSSMIAALFRLTEPSGVIRIDGVDIQSIGLDDLRQKISIIPQDPVIYSGTIRYNLDPFGQYDDSEIWSALDQVQLKTLVNQLDGNLDSQLSESGTNLSVGQRQLICLARAILRRNQILVLDEATANIDHQTDTLIQSTLRSQFGACTVLTIAHRLNSIIDSDRVLVLDAGQIVEFDVPHLLLQRQTAFHEMCHKTGPNMYGHLLQEAKYAFENRPNTVNGNISDKSIV